MKMKKSWFRGFAVLLSGMLLFSSCPTDDNDTVTGGNNTVTGVGPALTYNSTTGDWEDVDVVSGASFFRLDNRTFVYADNGGTTLKKVDVLNPTVALKRAEVGYTVAVLKGSKEGNIAVIAGVLPSSEVVGRQVKVYDSNLSLLGSFPFGDEAQATADADGSYEFGSLFSELTASAFAVGDKYAAAIWNDSNEAWTGGRSTVKATYVGIYNFVDKTSKHFKMTQEEGTPDNVLANSGIGSPASLATRGDYVLVGGASGTAAFKIGANLELTNVTPGGDTKHGTYSHWMDDNGYYVMDCAAAFTINAWKWNGASAPSVQVIDGLGANASGNRGYVRVICFDQDDPSKAYVCVKNSPATPASGIPEKPNGFYSLDLAAGTKEFLFLPTFKVDDGTPYALSPWGIEQFKKGNDVWYVLTGASVEAFKNPPKQQENEDNISVVPDWHLEMASSVHLARAFNADGRYFLVVKDGTLEDYPYDDLSLVLHEIKD